MVMEDDQCGARPRNCVYCTVSFTRHSASNAELERFGKLVPEVSVNVFIAPEVKVPKRQGECSLGLDQWGASSILACQAGRGVREDEHKARVSLDVDFKCHGGFSQQCTGNCSDTISMPREFRGGGER